MLIHTYFFSKYFKQPRKNSLNWFGLNFWPSHQPFCFGFLIYIVIIKSKITKLFIWIAPISRYVTISKGKWRSLFIFRCSPQKVLWRKGDHAYQLWSKYSFLLICQYRGTISLRVCFSSRETSLFEIWPLLFFSRLSTLGKIFFFIDLKIGAPSHIESVSQLELRLLSSSSSRLK